MLHAHDRAIFAVLAGVWPGLQTDSHDGMGGRERDDMRQELREAKVPSATSLHAQALIKTTDPKPLGG